MLTVIGLNIIRQKLIKFNENGEWNHTAPEVSLAASPLVPAAFGARSETKYWFMSALSESSKLSSIQGTILALTIFYRVGDWEEVFRAVCFPWI